MRTLILSLMLLGATGQSWAKTANITIKSSMVCGMCEETIRNGLVYEKGIKRVTFDLDKNEIYIKYNPKQIGPDDIRARISALGYDADGVKANETAFKNLDACCQSKDKCEELGISKGKDKHAPHKEEEDKIDEDTPHKGGNGSAPKGKGKGK
ncbi:MAG: heavy-metal-associated domain-containing protein [Bacteroidetes bacterium]|nr:heavy-metal-associated domain-containing protein [Bacteroidota bacterium]